MCVGKFVNYLNIKLFEKLFIYLRLKFQTGFG